MTTRTDGRRESWSPGESAHFEYHCLESDDSADAQLWYRSHQVVTVVRQHTLDETDYLIDATFDERAEAAMPMTYAVRFADGFEGTAWEDELFVGPEHFYRPDPPKGPA